MSKVPDQGTRVWVKQSAVESVRNPRLSFKEKMMRKPPSVSGSLSSHLSRQSSTSVTASMASSFSTSREYDNDSEVLSISNFSLSNPQISRNHEWGWKPGYMMESSAGSITVCLDADGPESSNSPLQLPVNALSEGDVVVGNDLPVSKNGISICPDDLISLVHLHEPAVVHGLESRYSENKIYTSTGPVLLAVNPFQGINGLYGENTMKLYWEKAENNGESEDLPPHVYSIADDAFRSMMRRLDETLGDDTPVGCDQSILVSGESGAGKTVTTKFVMKYLAALSQRAGNQPKEKRAYVKVAETRQQSSTPSWKKPKEKVDSDKGLSSVTALSGAGENNSIEAQVLQSNPILESFGNARTMRNDNSSRFGKFIEIQFTRMGRLVGAQIETYLLEKVRLVTQSLGERNYHIFYEMLSGGMHASELRNFFIASTATPDDFKISASGTYDRRDGVSDKETFAALRTAMDSMEFPKEEQRDIFATAAAILHASNLTFLDYDQECALDDCNVHLQPVCHLLGVTPEDLNQALCHFSITAGRDTHVQRSLNVDGAMKGLEALVKATYGALFEYLVARINDSISFHKEFDSDGEEHIPDPATAPVACIGVLDIFGFESFQKNSFEQLCINYCNEALQQQFNAFVLKNEQEQYAREGIDWSFIEFPENQDVLDLIEKRGSGILGILDDQCRAPGTSDKTFALDVYSKCKNQTRFSANRKQTASLQFAVHHYAGPVEYSTEGFIEKNRDELPKEATELLQNSYNPFIQMLADIIEMSTMEQVSTRSGSANKMRRQDSARGRSTVGGQFRRQLRHLRDKIDHMSPHYIRCLKPNDELVPDQFNRSAVAEQLRCGGILEAVRVARAGFSNHYPHEDFLRRYRCLAHKEMGASRPKWEVRSSFGSSNLSKGPSMSSISNDAKSSCTKLIQILTRKITEKDDETGNENSRSNEQPKLPIPSAQAKTYSFQSSRPSWSKGLKKNSTRPPVGPATSKISAEDLSSKSDWTTNGIQVGKTKVFLRHTAFEALERLRSREQGQAAVKLNALFRMYLARNAYVHVRNVVRRDMHDLHRLELEYKESKEQDYGDDSRMNRFIRLRSSYNGEQPSLVDAWATQIRESLHNPVPRSEWGKQSPTGSFKWMLVDGLWVKNHEYETA